MKLILVFAALLLFVGMCEGYFQQLPLNAKRSEYLLFQLSIVCKNLQFVNIHLKMFARSFCFLVIHRIH